jgi:hypothetical protein
LLSTARYAVTFPRTSFPGDEDVTNVFKPRGNTIAASVEREAQALPWWSACQNTRYTYTNYMSLSPSRANN